jgi:hypothetical protein
MGLGRIVGGLRQERRRGALLADPGRLELLSVRALTDLLPAGALSGEPDMEIRAVAALDHAVLEREAARRTGDLRRLANAYECAASAAAWSGAERRLYAGAQLQTALCALAAAEIFGDTSGPAQAEAALAEAETALNCQPGRLGGPGLIRARLASRRALIGEDGAAVLEVCTLFEDAAAGLEARVRVTGAGEPEWAAALCERAELMVGAGALRKDAGLLDRAARDMGALSSRLDPLRLPLSWMRAQTLQGSALRALGEITGEARLMKDAAVALGAAFEAVPADHSPMDRARAAHGLGLALQALAEASGEPLAFRSAQTAFDRALAQLGDAQTPFRSMAAYDRAACLARRAERSGDVFALAEAEGVFRADLAARTAHNDPVGWAVVQVALARVYQARAELTGERAELADAAFALTEALEVFTDHGQATMAQTTMAALERVRGR